MRKPVYIPKKGEVLEFFKLHNIDYKASGTDNIAFDCPYCSNTSGQKYTAGINLETGYWQCWRHDNCGEKGTYKQLVYKVTGGAKEMGENTIQTTQEQGQAAQVQGQDVKVGIGVNKSAVKIYNVADIDRLTLSDEAMKELVGGYVPII